MHYITKIETEIVQVFKFKLNLPTPVELITWYIQLFETKVTKIDFQTIMLLRGQSISNSYICLHITDCVLYGPRIISLVSIIHVMLEWNWNEIA